MSPNNTPIQPPPYRHSAQSPLPSFEKVEPKVQTGRVYFSEETQENIRFVAKVVFTLVSLYSCLFVNQVCTVIAVVLTLSSPQYFQDKLDRITETFQIIPNAYYVSIPMIVLLGAPITSAVSTFAISSTLTLEAINSGKKMTDEKLAKITEKTRALC